MRVIDELEAAIREEDSIDNLRRLALVALEAWRTSDAITDGFVTEAKADKRITDMIEKGESK